MHPESPAYLMRGNENRSCQAHLPTATVIGCVVTGGGAVALFKWPPVE